MPTHLDWPGPDAPDLAEEYDRYAAIYDLIFQVRQDDFAFYANMAAEILPAGGELLELGTGTGRVAEHLIRAGFRVTGVDLSRAMLAQAEAKQARLGGRFATVRADVRSLALGRRFRLVIAPFGMMAHLLEEADRRAVMKTVFNHLEPGGTFLFDDLPGWLAGPATGDRLEMVGTARDPETGLDVRATTTSLDIAGAPLTLCYHFLDWLDAGRLVRRVSVRIVYRNTALEDELRWLREAGFDRIEVLGGFNGRPFDRDRRENNRRLIIRCARPDGNDTQR